MNAIERNLYLEQIKCIRDCNEGVEGGKISLSDAHAEILGLKTDGARMVSTPLFLKACDKVLPKVVQPEPEEDKNEKKEQDKTNSKK
jgi:hypothetical protein